VDALTTAHSLGLSVSVTDTERVSTVTATHSKDEYSFVNRFESMYYGHCCQCLLCVD